ncbi:MAG: hypothetical protein ACLFPQ_04935 [Candidatus Woesearchaeota archaeon]
MSFFSSAVDFMLNISKEWFDIVLAPFRTTELLWIIIPIYLSWIFTERYQEMKGTSFGNAISNGVVVLWVGVDWTRMLVRILSENGNDFNAIMGIKFGLAALAFVYGLMIIVFGIKAKKFIHYFGRIREVTYIMIMFSPMIYGAIDVSWNSIFAVFIYFPIFYLIVEIINKILPSPKTYEEDTGSIFSSKSKDSSPFSSKDSSPFSSKDSSPFGSSGSGFSGENNNPNPFNSPNPFNNPSPRPMQRPNPQPMMQRPVPNQMRPQFPEPGPQRPNPSFNPQRSMSKAPNPSPGRPMPFQQRSQTIQKNYNQQEKQQISNNQLKKKSPFDDLPSFSDKI